MIIQPLIVKLFCGDPAMLGLARLADGRKHLP